ncbi:hypothetical protein CFPU101_10230 [Chroococcus sp. FPU101]|nr:hypothetical protein CFPU101_10230 [Chroococcus sp. FPU101]
MTLGRNSQLIRLQTKAAKVSAKLNGSINNNNNSVPNVFSDDPWIERNHPNFGEIESADELKRLSILTSDSSNDR